MRRQILAIVLSSHWAALFGLLAILSVADPRFGVRDALHFLGFTVAAGAPSGGAVLAGLSGVTFGLAAALFLWMLAECLFGHRDDSGASSCRASRRASAGGVLALLFLLGLLWSTAPGGSHLLLVECAFAAILLSHLCVCAEQFLGGLFEAEAETTSPVRGRAQGAAHAALLARLSGRPSLTFERIR